MSIRPYLGTAPRIAPGAYVDPAAVVIGDVEIGEDASFWPCAVARGDVQSIRVGARSNVQDGAVLHVTHDGPYSPGGLPLVIGADVTVGHGAILHACTIEDACLIGMHATVLDGARVRRHSIVGAGALVPPGKIVGEGELWLGNPAKLARRLSDEEIERLYYSARHYVSVARDHLAAAK
ncbi:MAG TPA: gamma carbonic anhydrase family protein [Dokdonella sp.]